MSKMIISKSQILSHRQCPKRAWLEVRSGVVEKVEPSAKVVQDQGQLVHATARMGFPDAVRIPGAMAMEEAAGTTHQVLAGGVKTILEAGFVAGNLGVRVDVLTVGSGGCRIIEIKSGSEVSRAYVDDCAIQYKCLTEAGLEVEAVEVMHPDTELERAEGGTGAEVLISEEVTDAVKARADDVQSWLDACEKTLMGGEPDVEPGDQCGSPNACPFAHHCGKPVEDTSVDKIEYLPSKAGPVGKLIASGVTRISDTPVTAMINARNALVREAVIRGGGVVVAQAAARIKALAYPRSFLDFEAASFSVPRFAGMRAYQALPFQWSAHRMDRAGAEVGHAEFLDATGADPRRAFAESLLAAMGTHGAVLVYSAYEKARIMELAVAFPDLADGLLRLVQRIVDLLPVARRGYYHPNMRGSWSLKKIVPTLPRDAGAMDYDELEDVADGMGAQAAYNRMINPGVTAQEKAVLRVKMLSYCKTDTAGLVRFVRYMESALDQDDEAGEREKILLAA